jgi:hypothetical protein
MQLKHLPICFLVVAAICLAGAINATANPNPHAGMEFAER